MTSSRLDWDLGEARLISSASIKLHMAAPCLYSSSLVSGFIIEKPTMSEGMISGVSWMRLNLPSTDFASAETRRVFPTPGTSSIRICPPQSIAASTLSIEGLLPTMIFSILSIRSFVLLLISYLSCQFYMIVCLYCL